MRRSEKARNLKSRGGQSHTSSAIWRGKSLLSSLVSGVCQKSVVFLNLQTHHSNLCHHDRMAISLCTCFYASRPLIRTPAMLNLKPTPILVVQMVKNLPTMWETWVQSLGWEDPPEKGMATHSSILAWRIRQTV